MTDTDADREPMSAEEKAGLDRAALLRKLKAWFKADR